MRLGILPFEQRSEHEAALAAALTTAEIDVILADTPVVSAATARTEATRLHRADPDAVLLRIAPSFAAPAFVSEAALHLSGLPLLLSGDGFSPAFLDAIGILTEGGIPFDRVVFGSDPTPNAALVLSFLRENRKQERQRGIDAARGLYGQRLFVPGDFSTPDPSAWAHQFGVLVTRNEADADFAAPDGDVCAALTRQILAPLAAEGDTIRDITIDALPAETASLTPEEAAKATFARVSRRKGRYTCLVFTGTLSPGDDADFAPDCPADTFFPALLSARLHAVSGSHTGAIRAACEALDIEPVVLHPA